MHCLQCLNMSTDVCVCVYIYIYIYMYVCACVDWDAFLTPNLLVVAMATVLSINGRGK